MDDPTIPGLTGALDYQPEHREEGIAFTLYPADTSEPLAYILRGPGAEQIVRRIVQCVNSHDDLVGAIELLVALNADDDETTLNAIAKARAAIEKATGAAS